ncbi:hypothetical protein L3476_09655 [Paenibacillus thiaminolyticus]|uniref:hypothetical protein n=1 Tax=Paenibacillus thiaminolyticus TaxID=49283 RepID=UPI00197FF8C6|nr:hypothetical protein [Paenibacillus thiaminolyticus]WCR28956.1 hypothetical protein L3476_09655 [Paenibacillus thiaminolyticus]
MITGPEFKVEMVGSNITSMGYDIPIEQVDAKALEAAKEAVLVTLGKPVPLVQAFRSYTSDKRDGSSSDVHRFKDEQQNFLIEIGYTSRRVLSVYASGLLETGTNFYTFTKEGSPTIEGEMNRHFQFYRFDMTRNNGTMK